MFINSAWKVLELLEARWMMLCTLAVQKPLLNNLIEGEDPWLAELN